MISWSTRTPSLATAITLPIPDRERPAGHCVTAPVSPPKLGVPAVPWGTGDPTLPRPGLGSQMGASGAWFALEPVGRPRGRLRRGGTHGYATLLTATCRPGALSPSRLSPPPESGEGNLVEPPGDRSLAEGLPDRRIPAAPASATSPGTRTRSRPPGYRDPTAVWFPARRGSTGRPRRWGASPPRG
jgi:hypothetical protein